MKDTTIRASVKKRELKLLVISLIIAFLLNVFSIIIFNTKWIELLTTFHITILLTVVIYGLSIVLRGIYYFFMRLLKKIKS